MAAGQRGRTAAQQRGWQRGSMAAGQQGSRAAQQRGWQQGSRVLFFMQHFCGALACIRVGMLPGGWAFGLPSMVRSVILQILSSQGAAQGEAQGPRLTEGAWER